MIPELREKSKDIKSGSHKLSDLSKWFSNFNFTDEDSD